MAPWRLLLCVLILAGAASPAWADPAEDRRAALQLLGRGTAAFDVGDVVAATRHWTDAIRLCRLAGAPQLEAEALARRGEAYRVEGQFREATNDLTDALARARTAGDEPLTAAASGALGNLAFMARRTAAAEPLLLDSQARARRLGDAAVMGASANDLGNLYAATGRPQQAAQAYGEAARNAEAAADPALAATAETNAARLALDARDPARAAALLRGATARLVRLEPGYPVGLALVAVGTAALAGTQPVPAPLSDVSRQAFEAARAISGRLGNTVLGSLALGGLGHLDERTGRLDEASRLTQQALFRAQQASAPDVAFRWEWQQARIDRGLGLDDAALASFRHAVITLRSVRQDIPIDYRDGKSSFQGTFGPLYSEFADLLLRRARRDPGHAAALIREARATLEGQKEAELQDYFRDSCIANLQAKQRGIETVAPDTAVVYPVILPDRLELLVSVGEDQRQIVVPITEARLRAEVEQFRLLLERRSTNEFLVPARRLYDLIARPIDAAIAGRGVDTLVIVPDGVLRTVPFAALHDGTHFLIERYAVATVPGLRLVDPRPLAPGAGRMLALGLSQSRGGFPALPNVAAELDAVHRLEGGTSLLNGAFLRPRFARELRDVDYSVVHIASHGQFGNDPSRTFVLAYDGQLNLDDLENDIKLARFRDPGLELLVLDACQTATGDDRAALGLAGLALKAGARSALATLWSVSDQASGPLVVDFYQQMRNGTESKARALQAAQRGMLADPLLSHPAYWAPFLLIGNWL
jgi:CHAT domain-containing protein